MSGPAGVREQGIDTPRSPRNLGSPAVSCSTTGGVELPHPKAPGRRPASGRKGVTNTDARAGIAKRKPQVRRKGRQGVGALHSTEEVGERVPPGPRGGKGAPCHRVVGRKHG